MADPIYINISDAAEGADLARAIGRHGLSAGLVRSGARWQVEISSHFRPVSLGRSEISMVPMPNMPMVPISVIAETAALAWPTASGDADRAAQFIHRPRRRQDLAQRRIEHRGHAPYRAHAGAHGAEHTMAADLGNARRANDRQRENPAREARIAAVTFGDPVAGEHGIAECAREIIDNRHWTVSTAGFI